MCGRLVVIDLIEVIEKRFNVNVGGIDLKENYNLSVGQKAPVITDASKGQLQLFQFGLTPSWAKKQMYLFNARSEGDNNKDDDPNFSGGKGIILKPAFRKQIRSQRCLVVASAFLEGPKDVGLSKPYLVYLKRGRPFALAGIWDTWENPEGDKIDSFSIVTTTANELLQKIGHHRMPVILEPGQEPVWLNQETPLTTITQLLRPFNAEMMNAYPVSPLLKSPKNNSKELLQPIGERVQPEYDINRVTTLRTQGWGGKKKKDDGTGTWGEQRKGEG